MAGLSFSIAKFRFHWQSISFANVSSSMFCTQLPANPQVFKVSSLPNQGQARKLPNGSLPAGQEALKAATARPWVACGSLFHE